MLLVHRNPVGTVTADTQVPLRVSGHGLAQHPVGTPAVPAPATWDFVGLRRETLDLRLLGVLGARYVVAAPLDVVPRSGGYVPIGPVSNGRVVRLTVPVRHDGVRRIDLLTATYARRNEGRWSWTLTDADGETIAAGTVAQADLRDNDWWSIAFTPVARSAGRTLTLEIRGDGSTPETSATLLATAAASPLATTLTIDGVADARTLWFRTFSDAPGRFGDATLVRTGDLNVYRNPHARPRAWFVERVNVADVSTHASAMHTQSFDTAREAWLSARPDHAPSSSARVTSIGLDDDRRTIGVDAPDGGVLLLSERAHAGWTVTIDDRPATWQVANAVLMAVSVPPGSRTVTLTYEQPFVRPALGLSLVALVGIAFASLLSARRPRS